MKVHTNLVSLDRVVNTSDDDLQAAPTAVAHNLRSGPPGRPSRAPWPEVIRGGPFIHPANDTVVITLATHEFADLSLEQLLRLDPEAVSETIEYGPSFVPRLQLVWRPLMVSPPASLGRVGALPEGTPE